MLDALEVAGAIPIQNREFHTFAYFVNILSPLWHVEPLEGSVLKDQDGPFFPELQREIDYLISRNAIDVSELEASPRRVRFKLSLNYEVVDTIIDTIGSLPDELAVKEFLEKLAFAFVEIVPDKRDDSATVDASWSDPAIDQGRVIDFGEWVSAAQGNAAWNVTQRLQDYAPEGVTLNRSEKLLMYMRLMKRRLNEQT